VQMNRTFTGLTVRLAVGPVFEAAATLADTASARESDTENSKWCDDTSPVYNIGGERGLVSPTPENRRRSIGFDSARSARGGNTHSFRSKRPGALFGL